MQFFAELGTMVTAIQGGAVDAIVQFSVLGGDALLNDPNFTVLEVEASTHRQIWMRCDTGQFVDKAVRQALALTFDREQMIETLFQGRAVIGNDHVIAPFMPFFNDVAVPQRTKDIDKAKQLLADAGVDDGLQAALHAVDLQEIPAAGPADPGRRGRGRASSWRSPSRAATRSTARSGARPSGRPAVLGRRRARHRRLRPPPDARRLPQRRALDQRRVELVAVLQPGRSTPRSSRVPGGGRRRGPDGGGRKLETILNDEVPVGLPFFYNYLSGHSNDVPGRPRVGARARCSWRRRRRSDDVRLTLSRSSGRHDR